MSQVTSLDSSVLRKCAYAHCLKLQFVLRRLFVDLIFGSVFQNIYALISDQGLVSRMSRKLFGSEKPFLKPRPAYSLKLVVSYVAKGIKIKITAKFRASRRLRFEDTMRIRSPEMRPKSLGTFAKRAPALVTTTNMKFHLNSLIKSSRK